MLKMRPVFDGNLIFPSSSAYKIPSSIANTNTIAPMTISTVAIDKLTICPANIKSNIAGLI